MTIDYPMMVVVVVVDGGWCLMCWASLPDPPPRIEPITPCSQCAQQQGVGD